MTNTHSTSAAAPGVEATCTAAMAALRQALARPLASGLHIVATPIGRLSDITLEAIATLARADRIYCEDTRVSRVLLDHYGIDRPLASYHEHNAGRVRPEIITALCEGRAIALVSDAGTPLVSDPGYKLVTAALEAGARVYAAPGPSALLAALVASGLPTDTFLFAGFLPAKAGARAARLAALREVPATLVFYEAPGRLAETLAALAAGLGDREAAVAREITKRFEEMRRASLATLAGAYACERVRGEIAIVVAPPRTEAALQIDDVAIRAALAAELVDQKLSVAARTVADRLGVPRSRVYDIGLAMKDGGEGRAEDQS
ncbi:MAG: 16S rRNA (cytidine(1402)-2'-O)-methyltransferase [Hyphomicrobiaceae bacterium]